MAWRMAGRGPLPMDASGQSLREDALHGQPAQQAVRAAAMAHLTPDVSGAWDELLQGNHARFEAAYTIWLQSV